MLEHLSFKTDAGSTLHRVACALALTALCATASAHSGRDADFASQDAKLPGTWLVQVTTYNCSTLIEGQPFTSLLTFGADGSLVEATSNPGFLPGQRSAGHGYWERSGRNFYHMVSEAFIQLRGAPARAAFQERSTASRRGAGDDRAGQFYDRLVSDLFRRHRGSGTGGLRQGRWRTSPIAPSDYNRTTTSRSLDLPRPVELRCREKPRPPFGRRGIRTDSGIEDGRKIGDDRYVGAGANSAPTVGRAASVHAADQMRRSGLPFCLPLTAICRKSH
jgi:hypothetical protein